MTEPAPQLEATSMPPPAAEGAESVSFWTIVKESVRGEFHHDFT